MTKKQFRTRLTVLVLLVLLLIGLISFASGKYVKDQSFDGRVTFTAKLAGSVIIQETTGDTYPLIPGHDIDKDPRIIITEKTTIPAYLFVEVTDTLDVVDGKKPVQYGMAAGWTKLTENENITVYCYDHALTPADIDIINGNITIQVLENDRVTVSQYLLSQSDNSAGDTDILKFNVKLIEKVGDADAAEAYNGYKE